tara:strand:+ start:210 stop:641 length:432 start_codon:yes stop_codon:yes gene_type:complete
MRNIKNLLTLMILMTASVIYADIPEFEESKSVSMEKLNSYFTTTSNTLDGGEVQFQFSDRFVGRIPKACAINAHIKLYNAKSTFAAWNQVSAVSFIGLSPKLLAKQSFYVGGLGQNLMVELKYDAQPECLIEGEDIRIELKDF